MQATWIWYPGDFEVWLGNKFNNRRTERGSFFPPFWKQDSHWPTVVFSKTVALKQSEHLVIHAEGQFNVSIDGQLQRFHNMSVPAGEHTISIKVWNQGTPPTIFIDGPTVKTDSSWQVTYEDKIWIDENGVAHGSGIYVPAGCWNFNSADMLPSLFHIPSTEMRPVGYEGCDEKGQMLGGRLYDFGREVFGCLKIKGLEGGTADIYYGESREEALDTEHCETLDSVSSYDTRYRIEPHNYRLDSKAFRYVFIRIFFETWYDDVAVDAEMAPFDTGHSGSFRSNDEELNDIWKVSARTLELTTQEFFMDGIKRDRWVWSGDAIQSYLMNYYLHFDTECVKRTIRQLRGKDPVTTHVNTIMDYTFYWFKSVMDYYQYTGDEAFVREMWPKMVTLMDFVLSRTNADGMVEGQPDDWIFVDWTDFPMHKRGTLCFEQILFLKALETLAFFADLLSIDSSQFNSHATILREKIHKNFWSDKHHAFLHALEDGVLNTQITKFPNMFAILYGLATEEEKRMILGNVLENPAVEPITTPYMRFYELETLCMMQKQEQVLREIKSYWGGMLREGATTFWEKYNPEEKGTEHLAMYGRPYGKSLCHAWGASPLYLLGRYFLGVRPTKPGYEEFEVRPVLGGLQWMEGDVPTPRGMIHVSMNKDEVTVGCDFSGGTLVVADKEYPIVANRKNSIKL